jgi:hypothetical protein
MLPAVQAIGAETVTVSVPRRDDPVADRDNVVRATASPLSRSRMPFASVTSVPRLFNVADGLNRAVATAAVERVVEAETVQVPETSKRALLPTKTVEASRDAPPETTSVPELSTETAGAARVAPASRV